jgi:hypothetical protein
MKQKQLGKNVSVLLSVAVIGVCGYFGYVVLNQPEPVEENNILNELQPPVFENFQNNLVDAEEEVEEEVEEEEEEEEDEGEEECDEETDPADWVGWSCRVWNEDTEDWMDGEITKYNSKKSTHTVTFSDGTKPREIDIKALEADEHFEWND